MNMLEVAKFCVLTVMALFLWAPLAQGNLLVVSPHPDDDVLMASGVVFRAVQRGEPVRVVYLTNGDYRGIDSGYTREGEAVAGQAVLGVAEDDLIFLGYPDGYLSTLASGYPNAEDTFTAPDGASATYGNRGLGRVDYHTYRFGTAGPYNFANVLADLQDIIATFLPDQIVVTSQFDSHPDHSMAYLSTVRAAGAVTAMLPSYIPVVNSTMVHCPGGGWPNPMDPTGYLAPIRNFTSLPWADRQSLDVPLPLQSTDTSLNPKYRAIGTHASQMADSTFMYSFVHKDEVFWSESPASANHPPIVNAGTDVTVAPGALVLLDATASRDPDGTPLSYLWVQRSGVPVALSDPTAARPFFTAPSGLTHDEVLFFELKVSDGQLTTLPDAVTVRVLSHPDVAPFAAATASSAATEYGQTAAKAIDGVVDGYPGDYTREWSSAGERAGAWLKLTWPAPYSVNKVVLYDRPNLSDNITGAILTFSDGSSVPVGPLGNSGGPSEITFPTKTVTSVTMTVTGVSASTVNAGLAEMEVYGALANATQYTLKVDVVPAGAGTVSVNPLKPVYYQGDQVSLQAVPNAGYTFGRWGGDASGNTSSLTIAISGNETISANFAPLPGTLAVTPGTGMSFSGTVGGAISPSSVAYTLQNPGNASIDWSAVAGQNWLNILPSSGTLGSGASTTVSIATNANAKSLPAGSYSDTVTFTNVTNGSGTTSRGASVTLLLQPPNMAPLATVTASSETAQYGQTAVKAVDGAIDGYPGDYTKEWATQGEKAGAWITLTWPAPCTVSRVVLYDRPNSDDNITSGTITFSDGSRISVGPLNNSGAPTAYSFPARSVTSLTLLVTGVSAKTRNVGLSEIQVY